MSRAFLLECAVQNYEWGKFGSNSAVGDLAKRGIPSLTLQEDKPYAELWMGTHPKGPSKLAEGGETLSKWVSTNQDSLGEAVQKRFALTDQLPFLFKVLSVNKALSIQAHPNKKHAEELHKAKPDKYPDSNHKPEMAIALTPFEGMCGFRPKAEIVRFLKTVKELGEIVGIKNVQALDSASNDTQTKNALQDCFTALMTSEQKLVETKLSNLLKRMQSMTDDKTKNACLSSLVQRLASQFPGDVGCFVAYFLNHMQLQPGQAMFLEANLPHAYLAGDCMECMACSDNVVRAGLTPKFKDVEVLCSMLKYDCKPASDNLFPGQPSETDPCLTVFDPPVEDFSVAKIELPKEMDSYTLDELQGPSIAIVIQGEATASSSSLKKKTLQLCRGSVLFIASNEKVSLSSAKELLMFRSYCQL